MRDDDERAGKCHQRLFDRFARRNVEMVRRLVEHEEVRAREHELEERQTRLLAAREIADAAKDLVAVEEERAEVLARLVLCDAEIVVEFADQGILRIQPLMLLREIADLHAAADLHAPCLRRKLAQKHAQERRLARAVRADDGDAVALADEQGEMRKHGAAAKSEGHILQFRHAVGALGGRMKGEVAEARLLRRQHDAFHTAQLALAPARLLRLDARAVTADVFLRALDVLLLLLVGSEQRLLPLGVHLLKATVISRVRGHRAARKVEDVRRHAVEEEAVVRDDDDAARIL